MQFENQSLNTMRKIKGHRVVTNFGFYEEDINRLNRCVAAIGKNKSKVVRQALIELERNHNV